MAYYRQVGEVPQKRHTQFRDDEGNLYREELIYEHDWRNHDLVAWDNIAVQHARPNVTLDGPVRTLRKLFAPIPPRTSTPARPTFASAG